MKRCIASFLTAVVIVPVSGCSLAGIAGSGVPASRSVDAKDFAAVEVSGPFEVTVERGGKFEVTVTSDDNLLEFIDVKNAAGKLLIGIQPGQNLRPKTGLKAKINMPAIEAVTLDGACNGSINGFNRVKDLKVDVHGASTIIGDIQAENLRLRADGATRLDLPVRHKNAVPKLGGRVNSTLAIWRQKTPLSISTVRRPDWLNPAKDLITS